MRVLKLYAASRRNTTDPAPPTPLDATPVAPVLPSAATRTDATASVNRSTVPGDPFGPVTATTTFPSGATLASVRSAASMVSNVTTPLLPNDDTGDPSALNDAATTLGE